MCEFWCMACEDRMWYLCKLKANFHPLDFTQTCCVQVVRLVWTLLDSRTCFWRTQCNSSMEWKMSFDKSRHDTTCLNEVDRMEIWYRCEWMCDDECLSYCANQHQQQQPVNQSGPTSSCDVVNLCSACSIHDRTPTRHHWWRVNVALDPTWPSHVTRRRAVVDRPVP